MKHTKGEWVIVYNPDKSVETIRVKKWEENDLMGDYRGCIIASFNESHGNRNHAFNEAEANAKLIAATPDLLDACKKSVELFEYALNKFDWGKSFLDAKAIQQLNEIPNIVRNVIKKATV